MGLIFKTFFRFNEAMPNPGFVEIYLEGRMYA
jgi:hypothetical protein